MAQSKFKINNTNQDIQTHADLQKEIISKPKAPIGRPKGTKVKKEQSNVSLSVAFTPSQKQQLIDYAEQDDRTAGYIIKKLLIKEGIIDANK